MDWLDLLAVQGTLKSLLQHHSPKASFFSAHSFHIEPSGSICACVISHFSRARLFVTPLTVAHQAPLSVGFSRQEYLSGLPCSPPGDLPDSGAGPASLLSPALAGGFFIATPSEKSPGSRQLWLSLHPLNVELIALGIGNCFT